MVATSHAAWDRPSGARMATLGAMVASSQVSWGRISTSRVVVPSPTIPTQRRRRPIPTPSTPTSRHAADSTPAIAIPTPSTPAASRHISDATTAMALPTPSTPVPRHAANPATATSQAAATATTPATLTPAAMLRDYIAWFMTGERLEQRLQDSDGSIVSAHVEWSEPGRDDGTPTVVLRFSNGFVTRPPYPIPGLTPEDVETVATQSHGASNNAASATSAGASAKPQLKVDLQVLRNLKRSACCRIDTRLSLYLKQAGLTCPICLGSYMRGATILCLPCGRTEEATSCLGHIAHFDCLRAEFHRRDACPLCRTPLPQQVEAEAFTRAQRNLEHLRSKAAHMPLAARSRDAAAAGGGLGRGDTAGAESVTTAAGAASKAGKGRTAASKPMALSMSGGGAQHQPPPPQPPQRRGVAASAEQHKQRDEARRWRELSREARRASQGAVTV